ncbi:MAG: glycosyltransferase family 39 protein [Phycisphaerae bacterium]
MTEDAAVPGGVQPSQRRIYAGALILIVLLSAYLRFEELGVRSLWHDELCTWRVSRMDVGESLRWGPELTKPPLYQFALRVLTRDPRPSEARLRLPAAICGVLTVLVGWWLGRLGGGWPVGLGVAGLLACNGLQVYYSQEARPYAMLVLGCALSTVLWYRLVLAPGRLYFYAYIVAAVLTLHAHYLAVLTVVGHFVWWLIMLSRRPMDRRTFRPLAALVVTGILCIGIVARYFCFRSSAFQGLNWIEPPTWHNTLDVLEKLTFGRHWILALLIPAFALWIAGACGLSLKRLWRPGGPLFAGAEDLCGLLLLCFLGGWFGLLVTSWLAHPAMVARYALPAAVPALLFPLIVAFRLDRRAPVILMLVFVIGTAPAWVNREFGPGLRELAMYLEEYVDPEREAVVVIMDATIQPGWEDSGRLGFQYYPMENVPIEELLLNPDGLTARNSILEDPRGLYLVMLWADPFPVLEAAGRQALPIVHEGRSYSQLLFTPYRLVRVAPIPFNEGKRERSSFFGSR